ncbi:hypothetical protein HU200_007670 [Digitaria exilis]|uniref:BHLH domain-containing protein n=1 Tax=Digitaria exilis TaxID=1010633 RepID=A0A835KS91_9POAL|nr:hypothetical protein HU200_007670 [Digitaria exilis]
MADDPFFYFGNDVDDEDYLMSLGLILPPTPPQPPAAPPPGSAFEAYRRRAATATLLEMGRGQHNNSGGEGNVHRRMFGYLRRIDHRHHDSAGFVVRSATAAADEATTLASSSPQQQQAPRSSRFRHITRERLRRERLSQGFADLHALLPPGASSRGGKNNIVGAAAGYIRELEGRKGWLSARNQELLELEASRRRWSGDMVVKVRAESEDHATAVDVLEAVLRRLKAMEELRVTAIRSCFCGGGMWMDVGVEGGRQVDKAITNALTELAGTKELGKRGPGSRKPSFSCLVESGVPMG